MFFWSKGLGRRSELVIACGTEKPERKNGEIVLHGKTLPPVVWNYTMTMTAQDFLDILDLGLSKVFIKFLLSPRRIVYALRLFLLVIKLVLRYIFVSPNIGLEPKSEEKVLSQTVPLQQNHKSRN